MQANPTIIRPRFNTGAVLKMASIHLRANLTTTPPCWATYQYRLRIIDYSLTIEPQTPHKLWALTLSEALHRVLSRAIQDLLRRLTPSNDTRVSLGWRLDILCSEESFLRELATWK